MGVLSSYLRGLLCHSDFSNKEFELKGEFYELKTDQKSIIIFESIEYDPVLAYVIAYVLKDSPLKMNSMVNTVYKKGKFISRIRLYYDPSKLSQFCTFDIWDWANTNGCGLKKKK